MEYFILGTLFFALVAYCVAGGADFGVGILEIVSPADKRRRVRELSEKAIAPIWEANHVWIVLIIVILFVGYPKVHTALTTSMHVPLLIMLLGIVLRGTAFTFRYYDIAEDATVEKLWTTLFRVGSVMVPLSFGAIAAGLHSGRVPTHPTTVWASYFAPWMTLFALASGVFTISLFAWLASVFLCGEVEDESERKQWQGRARWYGIACFSIGGITSATAVLSGSLSSSELFGPVAISSVVVASLAAVLVHRSVGESPWVPRIAAAVATAAILAGYWLAHYPVAVSMTESDLTWHAAAAPEASLKALAITLSIGLLVITPCLAALYKVFKSSEY